MSNPVDATYLEKLLNDFIENETLENFISLRDQLQTVKTNNMPLFIAFFKTSTFVSHLHAVLTGLTLDLQTKMLEALLDWTQINDVVNYYNEFFPALVSLLEMKDTEPVSMSCQLIAALFEASSDFAKAQLNSLKPILPKLLNRKVHQQVVLGASRIISLLCTIQPPCQLEWLYQSLLYCLKHVDLLVVQNGVEAVCNLSTHGCAAISEVINRDFDLAAFDMLRFPNTKIKNHVMAIFTNIANCCPTHRRYVRNHEIMKRLPAFVCHYDDPTCAQTIELLKALQLTVSEMLEANYITTMILHIAMSPQSFKETCYAILSEAVKAASPQQVLCILNEGMIRPVCTMLREADDDLAQDILRLLLNLVENHHALKIDLVRFDFDHAHSAENNSCVNYIDEAAKRLDPQLKALAEQLLSYLQRENIVLHTANET